MNDLIDFVMQTPDAQPTFLFMLLTVLVAIAAAFASGNLSGRHYIVKKYNGQLIALKTQASVFQKMSCDVVAAYQVERATFFDNVTEKLDQLMLQSQKNGGMMDVVEHFGSAVVGGVDVKMDKLHEAITALSADRLSFKALQEEMAKLRDETTAKPAKPYARRAAAKKGGAK